MTQDREEALLRMIDSTITLPTLPDVLMKLNKMLLNPRTSAKDVANVISSDQSITAKVLKVVNSAFYGFPRRISTITHAIVILGFNTVRNIVLSSSLFEMFREQQGKEHKFKRSDFWKHSICCGVASRVIARRIGHLEIEEAFLAGLLHDIGKVFLDQYMHKQFKDILERAFLGDMLIRDAEMEVLGSSHDKIGGRLFDKWGLSAKLVTSTLCHHEPHLAGDDIRLASIVHVADIFSRAMCIGNPGDFKIPLINETAWKTLNMNITDITILLTDIDAEFDKALIFLDFLR